MFFRKPPICHHSSQIPHRCHFGDCPPCGLICGKQLDGCKHSCPVRCHSAVKTIIRDKVRACHSKPVLLIEWLFFVLIHFLVFWLSWAGCVSTRHSKPVVLIDYSLFWFPRLLIVVEQAVRAGPWEARPTVKEEIVCKPCPPCQVPTPVQCIGLHEVVTAFLGNTHRK